MTKLFYKDRPLVGLDISKTGVKIMSIDPKKWLVHGYGSLDLDPQQVQASLDDPDNTYLADSLTSLLANNIVGTIKSDHVVIGIPTARTFIRTFSIPTKEEKHLKDAVEIEVDQYIPIPANLLYIGHEVIERDKEHDKTIVGLTAVPSSLVDTCTKAVRAAGLTPILAIPSIDAVARVLEVTEEGQLCSLIIDIGPASTDIAILDHSAIRLTGGVGIGGNTFTLDIAKKLRTTLENAHQLKVLNGLNAGPRQAKLQAALKPSLTRIATEARKVIRYYNERLNDNRKIEQVLIVGGGANIPGIGEYFTDELVMPARVASPWQQLNFGSLQEPSKQFRPRYITVAGLASIQNEEVWK